MIHRITVCKAEYSKFKDGSGHISTTENEVRKGDMIAIYLDDKSNYCNVNTSKILGTTCKMNIKYGNSNLLFVEHPKEEIVFPLKVNRQNVDEITLIVKTEDNHVLVRNLNDVWHLPIKRIDNDKTINEIVNEILDEITIIPDEIVESDMLCCYQKNEIDSKRITTCGCIWFTKIKRYYSNGNIDLYELGNADKLIYESQIPFIDMILKEQEVNNIKLNCNYGYFNEHFMNRETQNTIFVVGLRKGGIDFQPRIFNSFSKIDLKAIKKEMNISEDSDGVFEVDKFENHKIKARLCLNMQGESVHWEVAKSEVQLWK